MQFFPGFEKSFNHSESTERLESELKKFLKQRSEIEKGYVSKLTKLQKNFIPKQKKYENVEDSTNLVFRLIQSILKMINIEFFSF